MFNDLMVKLKEKGLHALAYADDLAVIGICKTKLLEAIDLVEEWAEDNKLIINKKKSGVIIHGFGGRAAKKDKGEIRGYPYKSSYTYLGIIIDRNLTFRE